MRAQTVAFLGNVSSNQFERCSVSSLGAVSYKLFNCETGNADFWIPLVFSSAGPEVCKTHTVRVLCFKKKWENKNVKMQTDCRMKHWRVCIFNFIVDPRVSSLASCQLSVRWIIPVCEQIVRRESVKPRSAPERQTLCRDLKKGNQRAWRERSCTETPDVVRWIISSWFSLIRYTCMLEEVFFLNS